MFGSRNAARKGLLDPRFPTKAAGAAAVLIDYDPVMWVRCAVGGEDRTDWRDRVLGAYDQDFRLDPVGEEHLYLAAVLDRIADDPMSTTATFLSIRSAQDEPVIVTVRVADEELTMLEVGDPERYADFDDLVLSGAPKPNRVGGFGEIGMTSSGEGGVLLRGWRKVPIDPPVHITTFGMIGGRKKGARLDGTIALARSVMVETPDGQLV